MAEENLGASFSIDITALKAGLAQANRLIRESESQFREAAAGMDDWSNSQEGLEARIGSLNDQIGIQEKKVNALVAEKQRVIDKMQAEGKSNDEISAAIDGVNKQIANESKQLDRLKGELDKSSSSLDKFKSENSKAATPAEKLRKTISDQEKSLSDLKEAHTNAVLAYGKNSKQAKALDKQIDELNDSLSDNKKKLDDASGSAKETGKSYEGLKGAAGVAAKAVAGIAAAASAAVGAFFGLAESTREYRQDMAQLAQNAKDSGADLDIVKGKLAEVSAATGEADAAMEGMNMLMATGLDTSQIETASDALAGAAMRFDGLKFEGMAEGLQETLATGAAVGPFAELIERTGGDLEAFNKGLANCTTEAERQAYAMQFLTESGLIEANAEYKKMNEDLYNAELAQYNLNEALAELGAIAEPIMTTLKTLATDLLVAITPFVSLIGEGLAGAFEGSAGAADTLAQGLGGIFDTIIDTAAGMLPTVIGIVSSLVPQVVSTLLGQIPDVLGFILDAIPMVLDTLSGVLPQIVAKIVELVPLTVNQLVSSTPQILQAAITLLMSIVNALPTIISELIRALPSVANTIISSLLSAIPILIDASIQLLMSVVEAIPVIIDALIVALPDIINTIIDGLISSMPLLLNGAIQLLMAVVEAIPVIITSLTKNIPQIVSTIISTLLSRLPDLISGAVQLFMGIIAAIPEIIAELGRQVPTIVATICSSLSDGFSDIVKVGGDLISGLWQGIKDKTNWLINKIKGFCSDALGAIKKFFGIESPSRVMADVVGKNLALGIGEGFEDSIGGVTRDINKSLSGIAPEVGATIRNNSDGLASGSNGGVVVNQVNNYSQAHSRYEIYRSKQQTVSAVRLALAGGAKA